MMKVTAAQIRSNPNGVEMRDFETVYIHFDRRTNAPVELVLGFRHKPSGEVSVLRFIDPLFGDRPPLPFLGDDVFYITDQRIRGWEASNRIEFGRIEVGDHQLIHWWARDVEDCP